MRITNKRGLPAPIVRALEADPYDGPAPHGREISVTQLISPPQIRALLARHEGELEQDASDMLHALLGQSFHALMAQNGEPGDVVERRFSTDVLGWTVSGQIDRLTPSGTLQDWKTCSAWKVMMGESPEWTAQLNIYAYILRRNGFKVHRLEVVAFLKDLNEVRKSAKKRQVPDCDIVVVPIPLWSEERTRDFLEKRIIEHEAAVSGQVPRCTANDTWNGKRCEKYCPVRHFCPQIAPDDIGFDVE